MTVFVCAYKKNKEWVSVVREKYYNVYGDTKTTFQVIVFQSLSPKHQFSQLGVYL